MMLIALFSSEMIESIWETVSIRPPSEPKDEYGVSIPSFGSIEGDMDRSKVQEVPRKDFKILDTWTQGFIIGGKGKKVIRSRKHLT